MSIVYFIRHAEPNYHNHDDFSRELTEKGMSQSQHLISLFKGIEIDLFFSSPYKRSVDTILPLANERNQSIHVIDDFCERRIGVWLDDFEGYAQKQWQDFEYHLPDGESLKEVQIRNIRALHELLTTHQNKTLVIGTHGTALSTMINYYYPDFGFNEFNANKHKFPWIMVFEFDGLTLKNSHELIINS